ncbi:hypothetical protein [Clostridium sp.]|uniref:hypothetical protein n=1 Tax=Clostridium sp. TaxID=1506 RepID=UPI0029120965|nr:hypothetical protein [Clostridium sp.]MDU6522133.1 hypothetical protein [Clostridium sp.]
MKKIFLSISTLFFVLGICLYIIKSKIPDIVLYNGDIIEQGFGFSAASLISFFICVILFISSFFFKTKRSN